VWSLQPPFDLLTTFSLPSPISTPTVLAIDPAERFFYVGTSTGDVHLVPLFRHRDALGASATASAGFVDAVGGGGQGSASVKTDPSVISHKYVNFPRCTPFCPSFPRTSQLTRRSPITALALSLSSTHLLIGTASGEIHMHALPSHQLLRTLPTHAGLGAITHLSTLLRPADFVGASGLAASGSGTSGGAASLADNWPIMEIKPFERIRAGAGARENREVSLALGGIREVGLLDALRVPRDADELSGGSASGGGGGGGAGETDTASRIAALESETQRLRASLERAVKVNDTMWRGVVQMKLAEDVPRQ
jgi:pre-rRNA-processing protein IPI3